MIRALVVRTVVSCAVGGTALVASSLLATHHCWSGEAPAGSPAPAHAVVTPEGGSPRLVAADVGFGIWLEDEPGVLHGFCP